MGQSPSTTAASRHDNASTRTLHSTSMSSNRNSNRRPLSFFRRISNRLQVTHSSRRFGRPSTTTTTTAAASTTSRNTAPSSHIVHTSASSVTSSVRRATQEAARQAAAVTGPPPLPSFLLQQHQQGSSRNSITSADSANTGVSFWNELLSSPSNNNRETNSIHTTEGGNSGNSFLRYLQIPLRAQQEINATMNSSDEAASSASSTTSRRMHILVIEYRQNSNSGNVSTTTTNDSTPTIPTTPPTYRFLGLRRPRSEVSTTSSTDTIQSMPLSMNSSLNNNARTANSNTQQQELNTSGGGQWIVYVINGPNAFQALSSSLVLEDNPSYEDLLWLSNMLGPVRPNTTTQAAVDEAIPVIDWSDDTKKQLKDDSCLVCLDEFALKQPVRILKCHHVFHRECVDRWLCEAHNSCPVCRGVPVET